MVLGGEGVAAEADLLNLILRRQPPAAEAVDEDLRAGPGHLRQLLGHLVGVVGERVDLLLRQGGREAVVATRRRIDVGDRHFFLIASGSVSVIWLAPRRTVTRRLVGRNASIVARTS